MNPIRLYLEACIGMEMGATAPPFTQWLGGTLLAISDDSATMEFTVRKEMTNPAGVLHGGVQGAFIDDMIGMTVAAQDDPTFFVSINLHVDYLGKARVGDKITAVSRIIRRGAQIINAQCELFNAQGELISRGVSNLIQSSIPKFPQPTET